MAIVVTILYWSLLYRGGSVDPADVHTHGVNAAIALIDIIFSGVPVRILHFIYPVLFGITYSVFSGIYFAAGGTNARGDPFIYSVLDYGNSPGSAAGWVLAISLVVLPIVNLLLFGLYSVRFWLTHCLWARRETSGSGEDGEVVELK